MSGDWIKVESSTPEKPEVMRLARALNITRSAAFGATVIFWCWLDQHATEGHVEGIEAGDIDDLVGVPGFIAAMQSVGWARLDRSGRLTIPNHGRLNGQSAKTRALSNARQSRWREAAPKAKPAPKGNGVDHTAGFEAFWSQYPRHQDKAEALKAWRKLAPDADLQATMLTALSAQKQSAKWREKNGEFIPYACKWLNKRRWEDEMKVSNPRTDMDPDLVI